jgi:hypothetical protein
LLELRNVLRRPAGGCGYARALHGKMSMTYGDIRC